MAEEGKKYEKILNLLKNSGPVFTNAEAVAGRIMKQLQEEKSKISIPEMIFEYLFEWVYIGWIRRAMMAAALAIVIFFGSQQALILKRINDLSGQRIQNGSFLKTGLTDNITNRILLYRLTGEKLSDKNINISEKEIDNLIKSINKLQVKYEDIIDLIGNDPQLRKYVEDKINENRKK